VNAAAPSRTLWPVRSLPHPWRSDVKNDARHGG
jgi:hypothetical protein